MAKGKGKPKHKITKLYRYIVNVVQYHEPITILAQSPQEAKDKVMNDYTWEPMDIAINVERSHDG